MSDIQRYSAFINENLTNVLYEVVKYNDINKIKAEGIREMLNKIPNEYDGDVLTVDYEDVEEYADKLEKVNEIW